MRILLLLFLLSSGSVQAQTKKDTIIAALNKEVWMPFLQGVNSNNDDLYIDVHSKDFHWTVGGQRTRIMNFKEYADDSKAVMLKRRDSSIGTAIDVRFLERNVSNDFAAEKCIFKYSTLRKGKEPIVNYGIGLVFSRKETGGWKKLVQYVSREEANEKIFEQAETMTDKAG